MSIPTILDRLPTPPCATLPGLDILEADHGKGRVKSLSQPRRSSAMLLVMCKAAFWQRCSTIAWGQQF